MVFRSFSREASGRILYESLAFVNSLLYGVSKYRTKPLCGQPSGLCADGWQKVYYTIEGTAQNGVDYEQITGCVYALVGYPIVPPPSDAPAEYIDIKPIPDNVVEGNETIRLVLGNGRSAQVIIKDGPSMIPTPMPSHA